jgi:hypothetical protein
MSDTLFPTSKYKRKDQPYNRAEVTLRSTQINSNLEEQIRESFYKYFSLKNYQIDEILDNDLRMVITGEGEILVKTQLGQFHIEEEHGSIFKTFYNFINSKNIDKSETKPKAVKDILKIYEKKIKKFGDMLKDQYTSDPQIIIDRNAEDFLHDFYESYFYEISDYNRNMFKEFVEYLFNKELISYEQEDILQNLIDEGSSEVLEAVSQNLAVGTSDLDKDGFIYFDEVQYSGYLIDGFISAETREDWKSDYKIHLWLNELNSEGRLGEVFDNTIYEYNSEYIYEFLLGDEEEFSLESEEIGVPLYVELSGFLESVQDIIGSAGNRLEKNKALIAKISSNRDPLLQKREKQISEINNTTLYRIASKLSRGVVNLSDKISIKDIKDLTKKDNILAQLFTKKDGQLFLQNFSSGFSIEDLIEYDANLPSYYSPGSFLQFFEDNGGIEKWVEIDISSKTWSSSIQKIFKETNYVFQLNIKPDRLENFFSYVEEISEDRVNKLKAYIKNSNHPTSRSTLSLGWIRYTVTPQLPEKFDGVVLDEIQTDWFKLLKGMPDLETFMDKWDEFFMRKFVSYVRKNLGWGKIYMPTYQTKLDKYRASPPQSLYKELPTKFGFKKNSDIEGFMLLEKRYKVYRGLHNV